MLRCGVVKCLILLDFINSRVLADADPMLADADPMLIRCWPMLADAGRC
jgi:hypothetical protein